MAKQILNKADFKTGYDTLLSDHYNVDPSTGDCNDTKSNTQASRDFEATQDILETSLRLADGGTLVKDALTVICDIRHQIKQKQTQRKQPN